MTVDEIARRPTPLTDKHSSSGASWAEDKMFMRRLEQDRAALMEALERCVVAANKDIVEDFSEVSNAADFAAETLAAVRERSK